MAVVNNLIMSIFLVLRPNTIVENDAVLQETENESGCSADRAAALEEQKSHMVWC